MRASSKVNATTQLEQYRAAAKLLSPVKSGNGSIRVSLGQWLDAIPAFVSDVNAVRKVERAKRLG